MIRKKKENGEKVATATTKEEFHEALNRGYAVELTQETGGSDRFAHGSKTWARWRRSTRARHDRHD